MIKKKNTRKLKIKIFSNNKKQCTYAKINASEI